MNPLRNRLLGPVSFIAMLALSGYSLPGRAGGEDRFENQQVVELRAVGADSMATLMRCWVDALQAQRTNIPIKFTAGLSADGAVAMIERRAEIGPFAREFFPTEVSAFQDAFGKQPILTRVAGGSFSNRGKTHALAIYVHRDNPLESLTLSQLQAIFAGGQWLSWGDLGLIGEWRVAPVTAYGMLNLRESGNPPGIVNFLRARINAGQPLDDSIIQLPGTDEVHALQQIVDAVAMDRTGIGYSGFGFVNPDSKTLALRDLSDVAVEGSPASVASHDYPLSRFVYMAIRPNLEPESSAAVAAFMHVVLGAKGQDCVRADAAGFFPLPSDIRAEEQSKVQRLLSLTSASDRQLEKGYWTQDGRVRVVGYNDMDRILSAINDQFSELHPGTRFELELKGTRTAPRALMEGRSLFAPMGAEFSDAALAEYKQRFGSDPIAIRVAHASLSPNALSGPLAFFVHADNPLERISLTSARRVFANQKGIAPITRWGELGLGGEWYDRSIKPCGLAPDTALATFLRKHKFDNEPLSYAVTGFRQSSEAVRFAADNLGSICFAAHNRRTEGVKALDVSEVDAGPAIKATADTLIAGLYPLDRYLYIYVRNSRSAGIDPLVRKYLQLLLSPTGQAIVASGPKGYLPLNAREIEEELAKLSQY